MSVEIKPYETSGGTSEERTYEGNERVIIGAYKENTAVAWSTRVTVADFAQRIGLLLTHPEDMSIELSGSGGPWSWQKAQAIIERGRRKISFIAIMDKAADEGFTESFTWADTAVGDNGEEAYPEKIGQVSMMAPRLNEDWLRSLLEATATPNIQGDIAAILASTQRIAGQRG